MLLKAFYDVLFFFASEKPFIEMKEPWTKVWEVNVGDQTSAQIPVKYSAYPEPSFKWYAHYSGSFTINGCSFPCI